MTGENGPPLDGWELPAPKPNPCEPCECKPQSLTLSPLIELGEN